MVNVEVVYITAEQRITQVKLSLADDSTVADALDQAGMYARHPETKNFAVGIFGRQVPLERALRAGDRIEIYRPLKLEPMERRRLKAGQSR